MNSGKIRNLLKDNKGETILEGVVAFTLLTIMMVLFSQGIKYATMTNLRADETRNDSDKAMEIIRGLDGFTCMGIPVSVMLKEVRSITEDYDYSRAAETARQLPVYRRCGGDAL